MPLWHCTKQRLTGKMRLQVSSSEIRHGPEGFQHVRLFFKNVQSCTSQHWFGRQDRDGFAYRSWVKGKGVPHEFPVMSLGETCA